MPPLNPSHLISRPASNPPPCNASLPGSERRSLAPDPAHEGLAALSGVPVRGLRFGHERRKRHPRAEQEALGPPRRTDGRRTPRASEGGAGAGAYGTNVAADATARMYKKMVAGRRRRPLRTVPLTVNFAGTDTVISASRTAVVSRLSNFKTMNLVL
jgi:hypothetical protein